MNRLGNLFQVAYLAFAVFFIYQAIVKWNEERSRAYLYIAIAIIALLKFFFNKKYRKRFEQYYKDKEDKRKGSN